MSVLTDDLCFESNVQPSLVYPSLPNTYHHHQQQQQQQSQDSSRQTCIHLASRLIKLRSELRSPSYMRSNYFPPAVSLGRANSLPNVNKDERSYFRHLDRREDESEIVSNTTDETSQLTYLSELVRRSTAPKPSNKDLLSLPSKQDFRVRQETSYLSRRPVSLRDIIYESLQNKEAVSHPMKTDNFSSSAFASRLIYASESKTNQKEEKVREEEARHAELTAAEKDNNCCTCNKKLPPNNSVHPTPSISRETTKSLFSTMSSDSEDDDFVYNKKSVVVRRRTITTAFLVSLSPSSAAAASVAKWRRSNKRQVRSQQADTTTS